MMNDNRIKSFPEYQRLLQKEDRKRKKRFLLFSIGNAFVFLLIGIFLAVNVLGDLLGISSRDASYRKLMQVYELISQEWYFGEGETTNETYVERALQAMVNQQSDDAYLTYYPAASLINDYGIGIRVSSLDGYLLVHEVYDQSPSSGELLVGDIISAVDGQDLRGLSFSAISALIRGQQATTIQIEVIRQDTILQKQLTRGTYRVVTTKGVVEDDYGILQISGFESDTVQGARTILDGFVEGGIEKLVIDLRDNGGGYIMAFEALADLFTPKGVVYGVYKHKDESDNYEAKSASNPRYNFQDIILLVNDNTASAAESFTAALKDWLDEVQVIGINSYGKGIAQKTISFSDGSQLRYTYAEYYRTNNIKLHEVGVAPDVVIDTTGHYKLLQSPLASGETWVDRVVDYLLARGFGASGDDQTTIIQAYQVAQSIPTSGMVDKSTLVHILQDYDEEQQIAIATQLNQAIATWG